METGGIRINFDHRTKSRACGFAFMLPAWLEKPFKLYIAQLPAPPNSADATREEIKAYNSLMFLRTSWTSGDHSRTVNMGKKMLQQHLRKLEAI